MLRIALALSLLLMFGCSETPTPGILSKIIYQDDNVTCYTDGFDEVCFFPGKDGRDGIDGRDGTDAKDGKDGRDGRDGTDAKDGRDGIDGRDGTDGTITVIHEREFEYINVPVPAPTPEPAKRIIAEAIVHPSDYVHTIPVETLHPADTVVHVSHLTDATHTEIPSDDKIWHIAIKDSPETQNEIWIYVYPRSLPPNDRRNDYYGGTEIQGTKDGANQLLRMYLEEHHVKIGNGVGNLEIIDKDLR